MDINMKQLKNILTYYTQQYNLPSLEISLDDYMDCHICHSSYINLSFSDIKKGLLKKSWIKRHPFAKTFETMVITIFLHEIKHEIDYLYRWKMYDMAKKKRYENKYVDINTECPLERRADKFAEREITKWI